MGFPVLSVEAEQVRNISVNFYYFIILIFLNNIVSLHLLQELIEGAYVICIHTAADTGRYTIIKGRTKSKK